MENLYRRVLVLWNNILEANKDSIALAGIVPQKYALENPGYLIKLSIFAGLFLMAVSGFALIGAALRFNINDILGIPGHTLSIGAQLVFFITGLSIVILRLTTCCNKLFSIFLSTIVIIVGIALLFSTTIFANVGFFPGNKAIPGSIYFDIVYILLGVSIFIFSLSKENAYKIVQVISLFLLVSSFLFMSGKILNLISLSTLPFLHSVSFPTLILTYVASYVFLLFHPVGKMFNILIREHQNKKYIHKQIIALLFVPAALWSLYVVLYYSQIRYNGIVNFGISIGFIASVLLVLWLLTSRIIDIELLLYKLEETTERYKNDSYTSLKISDFGLWTYEFATEYTNWSNKMYEIFQVEQHAGETINEIYKRKTGQEGIEAIQEKTAQAIKNNEDFIDASINVKTPDGGTKTVKVIAQIIYDANKAPLKLTGLCYNDTDATLWGLEESFITNKIKREKPWLH